VFIGEEGGMYATTHIDPGLCAGAVAWGDAVGPAVVWRNPVPVLVLDEQQF